MEDISYMDFFNLPIIINSFNRPTFLIQLIFRLYSMGYNNLIILDNNSSDSVTLEYLKTTPYRVIRLNSNLGCNSLWVPDVWEKLDLDNKYYAYTDCDVVPSEGCPNNFLEVFYKFLEVNPEVDKVGFSLKITDLPTHYSRYKDVILWESQYFVTSCEVLPYIDTELRCSGFKAPIDTTFALYRPGAKYHSHNSIRVGFPFTATHLPWFENSSKPFKELENYRRLSIPGMNSWDSGLNKL